MNKVLNKSNNTIIGRIYKSVLKPLFFLRDPEAVHDKMIGLGVSLGKHTTMRALAKKLFAYENPVLRQTVLGMHFKNPIGLSAGFDKNAVLTDILPSVGFGFAEVGSITGKLCAGNAKPRLWRLKKSQSLVVCYGLKNDGCEAISERLAGKKFEIPIGMSVAMTNCEENLDIMKAVSDYEKAFRTMEAVASYVTLNISCPNTRGGQPFVDPVNTELLLTAIDCIPTLKPIFIKLSPDLAIDELNALLDVTRDHRVHGIICTNLTKKRDSAKILDKDVPARGGISGKAVQELSDTMLKYIYKREKERFVLVGCGGVFTAEDAYKKIRLGASLVQMITGMIFEGPQVIGEINRGLAILLKRDGFVNVSEAIGVDNRYSV